MLRSASRIAIAHFLVLALLCPYLTGQTECQSQSPTTRVLVVDKDGTPCDAEEFHLQWSCMKAVSSIKHRGPRSGHVQVRSGTAVLALPWNEPIECYLGAPGRLSSLHHFILTDRDLGKVTLCAGEPSERVFVDVTGLDPRCEEICALVEVGSPGHLSIRTLVQKHWRNNESLWRRKQQVNLASHESAMVGGRDFSRERLLFRGPGELVAKRTEAGFAVDVPKKGSFSVLLLPTFRQVSLNECGFFIIEKTPHPLPEWAASSLPALCLASADFELVGGKRIVQNVVLPMDPVVVTGQVVDANRSGIDGVEVVIERAASPGQSVRLGLSADGRFAFRCPPGSSSVFRVTARCGDRTCSALVRNREYIRLILDV